MLKKIFLIFFFLLNIVEYSNASVKDKIINNLIKTENLTFEFKQTINEKTEEGNCIIEYPKKLFCSYNNINKKIKYYSLSQANKLIKINDVCFQQSFVSSNLRNFCSARLNFSNSFFCFSFVRGPSLEMASGIRFLISVFK